MRSVRLSLKTILCPHLNFYAALILKTTDLLKGALKVFNTFDTRGLNAYQKDAFNRQQMLISFSRNKNIAMSTDQKNKSHVSR